MPEKKYLAIVSLKKDNVNFIFGSKVFIYDENFKRNKEKIGYEERIFDDGEEFSEIEISDKQFGELEKMSGVMVLK